MSYPHWAIIVIAFAIGLWGGKRSSPRSDADGLQAPRSPAPVTAIPETKAPPREPTFRALIDAYSQRDEALARGDYLGLIARTRGSKGTILNHWAKNDPAAAWGWVQENAYPKLSPGTMASQYDLFGHWLRQDPAAVAAAVADSPDPWVRGSVQRAVVEILSGDDPQLAAQVIEQFDRLIPGPVWSHRDRGGPTPNARMLETIRALPDSGAKNRLRHQLAKDWLNYDWSAATAWVASLPTGEREVVERAVLESDLPRSLEGSAIVAARWLVGDTAPPGMLGLHSREVVKRWAKSDPGAAGEWVANHHVGATRALLEAELRAANRE